MFDFATAVINLFARFCTYFQLINFSLNVFSRNVCAILLGNIFLSVPSGSFGTLHLHVKLISSKLQI